MDEAGRLRRRAADDRRGPRFVRTVDLVITAWLRQRSDVLWFTVLPTTAALAIVAGVVGLVDWKFIRTVDFSTLWIYRFALLEGLGFTLLLTGLSVLMGLVAGTALAAGLQAPIGPLKWLISGYIEIFRNTPLVLQLFWIHFAVPGFTGVSTTPFQTGLIAMTLQSSAYLADVARAGIQAISKGQWDAADALGLTTRTKWFDIVLPQALKIMIPPLANIAVGYFKASTVLALLSVGELMTVAARVAQHSFRPIETFTVVGLIYLVMSAVFSGLTYRLERAYGPQGKAG